MRVPVWTVVAVALLLPVGPAGAEMYRWVDEKGGVHFTENLWEVPPEQRIEADRAALEREREPVKWNRVDVPPPAAIARPRGAAKPAPAASEPGRVHRLRIQRAGHEIRLAAQVDGVRVPFIADTGASLNTIPRWAVEQLGAVIDEETPVIGMQGVGGRPMRVPVITVDRVQLGSAVVRDVELAVVDTMSDGLLGMPFFNHFRVQIDPAAGLMTLEEIDVNSIEGVYGGYDESMWRMKFGQVHEQLRQVEMQLERLGSQQSAWTDRLEKERDYWENQLGLLEDRADRAGVPGGWRDPDE